MIADVVIADLLYLSDLFLLCAWLGRPVSRSDRALPGVTLIAGFSILAVVTTWLYVAGLSIASCSIIVHLGALASALTSRHALREVLRRALRADREYAWTTLFGLVSMALILLPHWRGGPQFSLFRGNQWDFFGYFESAVGYASRPYRFFTGLTPAQGLANPLWIIARANLSARPTIHLVFAVTAGGPFFKSRMPTLTYAFLAFLSFQSIAAIRCLVAVLVRRGQLGRPVLARGAWLIGAVFALGFWGQYAFDIDAWSQLGGMPIAIAIVATVLLALDRSTSGRSPRMPFVLLAVLVSGNLYVYPEGLLFHAPAIGLMLLAAARLDFVDWTSVRRIGLAMAVGAGSGLLFFHSTIGFGLGQAVSGLREHNTYWTYFQRFLFGRGEFLEELRRATIAVERAPAGSSGAATIDWPRFFRTIWLPAHGWLGVVSRGVELLVSVVAGILGLYFLTPLAGITPGVRLIWSLLLGCADVAVVRSATSLTGVALRSSRDELSRRLRLLFGILVSCLAGEMLVLIVLRQFWSAGKALSFLSPYLLVLLLLPLIELLGTARRNRTFGVPALVLSVYAACQLGFGGYRILRATAADGILYSPTSYPSVQPDAVNAKTNYDLGSVEPAVALARARGFRSVEVAVSDIWVRNYVIALLTLDDRQVVLRNEIHSYFSAGSSLGFQDRSTPPPDGVIRERWMYDRLLGRYRYVLSSN